MYQKEKSPLPISKRNFWCWICVHKSGLYCREALRPDPQAKYGRMGLVVQHDKRLTFRPNSMTNGFHNGAEGSALVLLQDKCDLSPQISNTNFRKHTVSIWGGGIFPLDMMMPLLMHKIQRRNWYLHVCHALHYLQRAAQEFGIIPHRQTDACSKTSMIFTLKLMI